MSDASCAVQCFKKGYSCSQAVLGTYGPRFGLDQELAFKVAACFGGGMRMGETCGVVTGAFMVIGLRYFTDDDASAEAKASISDIMKDFVGRFTTRNGSLICKQLLGCDIRTPESHKIAKEKGLFSSRCPKLVQDAGEIIDQILAQYI